MGECKLWYLGGLRRGGGRPWDPVRYPSTAIWNEILRAGPKSRSVLRALDLRHAFPSGRIRIAYDEDYLRSKGGMGLWGVVVALVSDGKYGIVIDEDVLVVEGSETTRCDRRKLMKDLNERQPAFTRQLFERVERRVCRQGLTDFFVTFIE